MSKEIVTQARTTAYNKLNPSEDGKTFIPMPSDLRHYIHHDLMTADKLFLYTILVDYYNISLGYAFPSHETLAVDCGKTSKTVGRYIKDLQAAGLLLVPSKGKYVPLAPLDRDSFFEAFPSAWSNYKKAVNTAEQRKKADKERWAAYRDTQRLKYGTRI